MAIISFRWSSVNLLAPPCWITCCGGGGGVDVDHAHHVVAALHGHADRLADAHLHDAAAGFQRSSCRASLVNTPSFRSIT